VNSVNFIFNENYSSNEEINISLKIDSNVEELNKEENVSKVSLMISIFNEREIIEVPFKLDIKLTGIFKVIGKTNNKLFEENAVAILFPYARSLITLYTTNANLPALILPPINVVAYIENKYNQ
jgi:preprotein translocase subunit SecB